MQGTAMRFERAAGRGAELTTLHNSSYAPLRQSLKRALGAGFLAFSLLLACLSPVAAGGARADLNPPRWGYLDNGMAYLLLENHAAPLIGSSVFVHSGSAREDFTTSGASHFLEHLLFNGTESRTQEQLYAEVDALGAYNNATTRRNHVLYMMLTPSEKIRQGLEIQRDMLFHSILPPEKLEKERGIILAELAKDKDAGTFDRERLLDLMTFGPGGLGLALPVLGSERSIKALSRETILSFYKGLYTPQNMSVLVIGDFASSEMERALHEIFGAEPPGPVPPAAALAEPAWDPSPTVASSGGATAVQQWTFPGPSPDGPACLAVECLTSLLAGESFSPFERALRERFPRGIHSCGGWLDFAPGGTFLRIRVETDADLDWRAVEPVVPEILRTIPLPSESDLHGWKVSQETEEFFLREKPHFYGIVRGDKIAGQGLSSILTLPERLARLTIEDLETEHSRWPGDRFRLAVVLPREETKPDDTSGAGAAHLRTTLRNGIDLLVLSGAESPVLALHLLVRGRSEVEPDGLDGAVELLHRLMQVRTSKSSPEQLARRLRGIGAEVKTADDPNIPYDDFYSSPRASFVRLQTLDEHAEEAFALLAELLGPPAWTDEEFGEQQKAMLAAAQRASASAATAGRAIARRALHGSAPRSRAVFGTPETLARITPPALRDLARRYWIGNRMLLVVGTSLPPEDVVALAERHLGELPAGSSPPPLDLGESIAARLRGSLPSADSIPPDLPGLALPESVLFRVHRMDAKQGSLVYSRLLGRVDGETQPAIEVWNAVLSSAIQFQLRETEGLAYSIGSSVEWLDDGTVLWTASAGSASKNLPRILAGFDEFLGAALANAPDSAAVTTQAAQIYGRALMRRATRMNRAYAAGMAMLSGEDPLGIDERLRAPMAVTARDVGAALPSLRGKGPGLVVVTY